MASKNNLLKITQLIKGTGVEINKDRPAIEVQNLSKKFGRFISLEKVNFNVTHGVIHGFIGPNGSGKTTTIKSLIGAYLPSSGKLFINGEKAGSKLANKAIGYIPERASFPKHLNAIDYLKSMAELSGIKGREAKEKSMKILEYLGLKDQAKRKPITFSSGMQKKVLLAQSLLTDPAILILDEPAANLDPSSRSDLFQQLINLRNEGKTIFISSHVLSELEKVIDEVTFIYYGNLLFSGSVTEFNKKSSTIFIKTKDNTKLVKYFKAKKISFEGDIKTEIEVKNIKDIQAQKLLTDLIAKKFKIISFRSNDLQTSYESLAKLANKNNQNVQKTEKSIFQKMAGKINTNETSKKGGK